MFVDASALVSILFSESDASVHRDKIDNAASVLVSPMVIYETTTALMRQTGKSRAEAVAVVETMLLSSKAKVVVVDKEIGEGALEAFERFGRGRHKAGLNMGDCFAYACAKAHNVPLLFNGRDFSLTDIAVA